MDLFIVIALAVAGGWPWLLAFLVSLAVPFASTKDGAARALGIGAVLLIWVLLIYLLLLRPAQLEEIARRSLGAWKDGVHTACMHAATAVPEQIKVSGLFIGNVRVDAQTVVGLLAQRGVKFVEASVEVSGLEGEPVGRRVFGSLVLDHARDASFVRAFIARDDHPHCFKGRGLYLPFSHLLPDSCLALSPVEKPSADAVMTIHGARTVSPFREGRIRLEIVGATKSSFELPIHHEAERKVSLGSLVRGTRTEARLECNEPVELLLDRLGPSTPD